MPKQTTYIIEFVGGGPLDGEKQGFSPLPADGYEITHEGHSYCFSPDKWAFTYIGRWRHIEIGSSLLTYRTFGEALRQIGQLQTVGAITASQSLDFQRRIKQQLRGFNIDSKD